MRPMAYVDLRVWMLCALVFVCSCDTYHQRRWEQIARNPQTAGYAAELSQQHQAKPHELAPETSSERAPRSAGYQSTSSQRPSSSHRSIAAPRPTLTQSPRYPSAIPVEGASHLVVSPYSKEGPYIDITGLLPGTQIECPKTKRTILCPASSSRVPGANALMPKPSESANGGSYWLNTDSNVRHNAGCRWFENTKYGRNCGKDVGSACGICGG